MNILWEIVMKKNCFVITPFGEPFDSYYDNIIKPAIKDCGLIPIRADEIYNVTPIINDIFDNINNAAILIADVTGKNANVNYEIGVAHALQKPVIIISKSINDVPFDYKHLRAIIYNTDDVHWVKNLKKKIKTTINNVLSDPSSSIIWSKPKTESDSTLGHEFNKHTDIKIGSLIIKNITLQHFPIPLEINDIICELDTGMRTLPPEFDILEFDYLPKLLTKLEKAGKTVNNNELYALKKIIIDRPQKSGERQNRPKLTFEKSNFYQYLMINDSLDLPLLKQESGEHISIREHLKLDKKPFQWSLVSELPFYQWFATVTAVITKNNFLVIALRSDMQAIGKSLVGKSYIKASMSCAEGMLSPIDSITIDGKVVPNPFETAKRALKHELGLHVDKHYEISDLKLLAIGYDLERYQPVGVFYIKLADLMFEDVKQRWYGAQDRQENVAILSVPMIIKSIKNLLNSKLTYNGKKVSLFSNHQQLGVTVAAAHHFGYETVISNF